MIRRQCIHAILFQPSLQFGLIDEGTNLTEPSLRRHLKSSVGHMGGELRDLVGELFARLAGIAVARVERLPDAHGAEVPLERAVVGVLPDRNLRGVAPALTSGGNPPGSRFRGYRAGARRPFDSKPESASLIDAAAALNRRMPRNCMIN